MDIIFKFQKSFESAQFLLRNLENQFKSPSESVFRPGTLLQRTESLHGIMFQHKNPFEKPFGILFFRRTRSLCGILMQPVSLFQFANLFQLEFPFEIVFEIPFEILFEIPFEILFEIPFQILFEIRFLRENRFEIRFSQPSERLYGILFRLKNLSQLVNAFQVESQFEIVFENLLENKGKAVLFETLFFRRSENRYGILMPLDNRSHLDNPLQLDDLLQLDTVDNLVKHQTVMKFEVQVALQLR